MACGHDALEQRLTMFADRPLPLARFGHLKRRSVRVPQDDVEAFAARKGDVKQLSLVCWVNQWSRAEVRS